MKPFFLSFFLLISFFAKAQNVASKDTPATPDAKKVYTFVEQMPVAGYNVANYLAKKLEYPEKARDNNIQGRVIVKFVVDQKGRIKHCKVAKGIGGGCDGEALRVVRHMPRWQPGKQTKNGKLMPVKVYYMLPIVFKLK